MAPSTPPPPLAAAPPAAPTASAAPSSASRPYLPSFGCPRGPMWGQPSSVVFRAERDVRPPNSHFGNFLVKRQKTTNFPHPPDSTANIFFAKMTVHPITL